MVYNDGRNNWMFGIKIPTIPWLFIKKSELQKISIDSTNNPLLNKEESEDENENEYVPCHLRKQERENRLSVFASRRFVYGEIIGSCMGKK
jgi:hypothetical protein